MHNNTGDALVMVAPNGARRSKQDHPALPLTIAEITQTAVDCAAAGANAIHAHTRDCAGAHVLDAGRYRELQAAIADALPGFPVQITTESAGKYTPAAQRQLLYDLQPPAASVSLSEMLADGDKAAARRLYYWANEAGVLVQHILYTPAEVARLARLQLMGVIPRRLSSVLFVLGRYAGDTPGAPDMLPDFLAAYEEIKLHVADARFMVCAFGAQETACLIAAAQAGGDCRVGFENNLRHPNGDIAENNAARVAEVVGSLNS